MGCRTWSAVTFGVKMYLRLEFRGFTPKEMIDVEYSQGFSYVPRNAFVLAGSSCPSNITELPMWYEVQVVMSPKTQMPLK